VRVNENATYSGTDGATDASAAYAKNLSRPPLLMMLDIKPAITPAIRAMEAPVIADSAPLANELNRA
jgi:hypothetical protein